MATCAGGRGNQDVASSFARGTRRGRGGSGVFAATGYPGAGRRQLGRVTRPLVASFAIRKNLSRLWRNTSEPNPPDKGLSEHTAKPSPFASTRNGQRTAMSEVAI